MINHKVTGLREIQKELKRLPDVVAQKMLRDAVKEGAKFAKAQAKRNLDTLHPPNAGKVYTRPQGKKGRWKYAGHRGIVKSGHESKLFHLRDTIVFRFDRQMSSGTKSVYNIGPTKKGFYGHILEFGAKAHIIKPRKPGYALGPGGRYGYRVKHPGYQPNKKWLTPALEDHTKEVVEIFRKKINKEFRRIYPGR